MTSQQQRRVGVGVGVGVGGGAGALLLLLLLLGGGGGGGGGGERPQLIRLAEAFHGPGSATGSSALRQCPQRFSPAAAGACCTSCGKRKSQTAARVAAAAAAGGVEDDGGGVTGDRTEERVLMKLSLRDDLSEDEQMDFIDKELNILSEDGDKVKVFGSWMSSDLVGRKAITSGDELRRKRASGGVLSDEEEAQLVFADGVKFMKQGLYTEAKDMLEAAIDMQGFQSQRGGEMALWLAEALQGTGSVEDSKQLLRRLSRHPVGEVRRVSAELLFIAEAPDLRAIGKEGNESSATADLVSELTLVMKGASSPAMVQGGDAVEQKQLTAETAEADVSDGEIGAGRVALYTACLLAITAAGSALLLPHGP
jgi:hypothetical protein